MPIIIVAIFVLIIAFAGYFAIQGFFAQGGQPSSVPSPENSISPTPTPSPATNPSAAWPAYANTQYGFDIKYPDSFKISDQLYPKSIITFIPSNEEYMPLQGAIPTYVIYIKRMSDPLTDQQFKNFLLKNVVFSPSGLHPKSFTDFKQINIGGNNFYFIRTELFEGQLALSYFLSSQGGVYSFNLISTKVDWTNQSFDMENDMGHIYLKQMLSTLVFTNPNAAPASAGLEQACLNSGGNIVSVDCYCQGSSDFFNNCMVGACSCPPDPNFKKQVKNCVCGEGKCFDGTKCASLQF